MNWLKKPSTTGGIIFLVVLGLVVVGLGVVAVGAWRQGVTLMGLSLLFACAMRAVLPDERAGMLRVRRRFVDLTTLALCGGVLLAMATLIPDRV